MNNRTRIIRVVLIILISFVVGFYFGTTKVNLDWKNFKPVLNVASKEPPPGIVNVDFNPFWNVWQKLLVNYYDKSKLDQQKMLNGAITGMVQSLGDPFTLYLPPVQNSDFKQGLAGQFSGIGAELGMEEKNIIVIAPLDGSPAERAGIRTGDSIVKVNSESTAGWTLAQTVEKIRGPKGTSVTLTIVHKNSQKQEDLKIERDTITVKSVAMDLRNAKCTSSKCEVLDKGEKCTTADCTEFAYIRLSQFGDNTNEEWSSLVANISEKLKSDKNVKGIVFDLRNNPGGYLTDATFIASEFLPQGEIVVSEDNGVSQLPMYVSRAGVLTDPKLVVLINKGSASASEIVAGALKDHKRAILVGDTSYGKGTVQAAEDLGDGAGLHVTIAKWLTPAGTWVNGKGLTPDIQVSLDAAKPAEDIQLDTAILQLLK